MTANPPTPPTIAEILKYINNKIAYWTGFAEAARDNPGAMDATPIIVELHDIREYINDAPTQEETNPDYPGRCI